MIAVGDIHGDIDLMKRIISEFGEDHQIVWLGDFLDSRQYPAEAGWECLTEAIERAKGGDIVLWGNHEYHYLMPDTAYSGYRHETQIEFDKVRDDCVKRFRWYHWDLTTQVLFTHAGLSQAMFSSGIWEKVFGFDRGLSEMTAGNFKQMLDMGNDYSRQFEQLAAYVGPCRGGIHECGGTIWNDWIREHTPIPKLRQVFAHTPVEAIAVTTGDQDYNLDCLEYGEKEVLEIGADHNHTIRQINLTQ